jgi:hypothetical protein
METFTIQLRNELTAARWKETNLQALTQKRYFVLYSANENRGAERS